MANITNNDLHAAVLTAEDLAQVKGGGLLLPAVQKVREAASTGGDSGPDKWIVVDSVSFPR